jgi:septal ring factor EnvC (AmiA/AmiB activator)
MMRAMLWRVTVVCAVVLSAAPLGAQQAPTEQEIRESQRRLQEIQREREQLRTQMSGIQERVHDISSELSNLQQQVNASGALLSELEYQVSQRETLIATTTRELLSTQDRLAERTALLNRRLRDIYKRGPLHTAEVLLTASSFSDLINRYRYLLLIARRDRALVEDVSRLEGQLSSRERSLRRGLSELNQVQGVQTSEYAQLESLETQQERALSGARERERSTAQRIAQLAADERELSSLIATLERQRREAERLAAARRLAAGAAPAAPAAASITTADLGNLGWPLDGRVIYRFGRAQQPNGTIIRWNGLGIGAAAGTGVRAVEAGTVVMAGPFEGYGPTVVLSHGGGYYSLYLYLRDTAVAQGDEVTATQVIGTVGGESTPEGPHIEFQIRAPGGQAVDPLSWLRGRAGG